MTGSVNLYRNEVRYIGQFTQRSTGGVDRVRAIRCGGFTRLFTNYSYERVRVTEINTLYTDPLVLPRNPFLRDSLLLGANGQRTISKVDAEHRAQHGRSADLPEPGRPLHGLARSGRSWRQHRASTSRRSKASGTGGRTRACRSACARQAEYIHAYRLVDCRSSRSCSSAASIPCAASTSGASARSDPVTGLVLGGNKSLLFNIEQNFNIMSQFRIILFYDAGQVRDVGAAVRVEGNDDANG